MSQSSKFPNHERKTSIRLLVGSLELNGILTDDHFLEKGRRAWKERTDTDEVYNNL
jgi:hypothetical protein